VPGQLAQRNHAADRDAAAVDGWHELAVANPLVEVVLAARSSSWPLEQLGALLSASSFTAAVLPRHMLHAVLQKRLAQKARNPKTMIETTNAWAFGWAPAGTMLDSPS
jgi:hypothetical protein